MAATTLTRRRACNDPNDDTGFWLELSEFAATFHSALVVRTYDPAAWNTMRRGAPLPVGDGGCLNGHGWVNNPQFFLETPGPCDITVTLSQDDMDGGLEALGLAVVEYNFGDDPGNVTKLANVTTEAVRGITKDFVRASEIHLDLKLAEGRYAIMPMTFAAPARPGTVYVTTKGSTPHVLRDENEILSREQPTTGTSEHDQILLEAPPPPLAEAAPDQESVAITQLYALVGQMWADAHHLMHEKRKLHDRLSILLRAAEKKKNAAAKEAANA